MRRIIFCEDLNSVLSIWEWTTPRNQWTASLRQLVQSVAKTAHRASSVHVTSQRSATCNKTFGSWHGPSTTARWPSHLFLRNGNFSGNANLKVVNRISPLAVGGRLMNGPTFGGWDRINGRCPAPATDLKAESPDNSSPSFASETDILLTQRGDMSSRLQPGISSNVKKPLQWHRSVKAPRGKCVSLSKVTSAFRS